MNHLIWDDSLVSFFCINRFSHCYVPNFGMFYVVRLSSQLRRVWLVPRVHGGTFACVHVSDGLSGAVGEAQRKWTNVSPAKGTISKRKDRLPTIIFQGTC